MDTPLSDIMREVPIFSEEQFLSTVQRAKGLRTYPGGPSNQQALHAYVEKLAAKGLMQLVEKKGPAVLWKSAL